MSTGESADKVILFGIPIDNLTLLETVDRIEQMIRQGGTHQHVVVNVDKIVKLHHDSALRAAILGCDLISADGQPVVWASRLLGQPLKERVAGIDLFGSLIERCAASGLRPYLLGARPVVVAKVAEILKSKVNLAGWHDGYWAEDEEASIVADVAAARPDILFVAMSSPKKEMFLHRWKDELKVPFVMGVGGTFDVVAGILKRAPVWMQRCGLEWFYRLGQEPRRLWRRYLIEDIAFFWMLVGELRSNRRR